MVTPVSTHSRISYILKKVFILNQFTVVILVVASVVAASAIIYYSQKAAELGEIPQSTEKGQYEIAKLAAEIRQIRSDTSGSLFWLKAIGLFVTVSGAIGGYLIGQSQNTRKRLDFEHKKDVDTAYQSVVHGLSEQSAVLRATAAVKLGAILKSFPTEWDVDEDRRQQMIRLTKEVLAAALAIESEPKVLKTLTIALVLHKPWQMDTGRKDRLNYGDARELDLSGTTARDAYWARVDFSYTDFYNAKLSRSSLRRSILNNTQFYRSDLSEAVLCESSGEDTNFKFADLRSADLTGAVLTRPNFEGSKVYGVKLTRATLQQPIDCKVDSSKEGDGSQITSVREWLERSALPMTT
jgi:hypothetical protein